MLTQSMRYRITSLTKQHHLDSRHLPLFGWLMGILLDKPFSQHTHCRARFQTRVTITTVYDGLERFVLAAISMESVCYEMENDNIWNSTSGKIGKTIRPFGGGTSPIIPLCPTLCTSRESEQTLINTPPPLLWLETMTSNVPDLGVPGGKWRRCGLARVGPTGHISQHRWRRDHSDSNLAIAAQLRCAAARR